MVLPSKAVSLALPRLESQDRDKHSSLLNLFVGEEDKHFYNVDTCGQCYKNFTAVILRLFKIS
jgi:hypothetical protein